MFFRFFFFFLCMACGEQASLERPVKVISFSTNLQPQTTPSLVSFSFEPLKGLQDWEHLNHSWISLEQGGYFLLEEKKTTYHISTVMEKSRKFYFRYQEKEGKVIPLDYSSLIGVSILYHFERMNEWFQEHFQKSFLAMGFEEKSKIQIYFEPTIKTLSQDFKAYITPKFNAGYEPSQMSFLLFARSTEEKYPLSSNVQVLAHEVGHYLFHKIRKKINNSANFDDLFYDNLVLSAFDEGFADYFSFIFTGSTDVLGHVMSDSSFSSFRNFSSPPFAWQGSYDLLQESCPHEHYCLGTLLAQSFWKVKEGKASSMADHFLFFKALYESFSSMDWPSLEKDSKGYLNKEELTKILAHLIFQMPDFKESLCKSLQEVFSYESFLKEDGINVCI